MKTHTDREFELEGKLYRVLSDLEILENNPAATILDPRSSWARRDALQRLHHVLHEFMHDRNIYQQHPKWAELNARILEEFDKDMASPPAPPRPPENGQP